MKILRDDESTEEICKSCGSCCDHFEHVNVYVDDENFFFLKSRGYLRPSASGVSEYDMKQHPDSNRCIALEGEIGKSVQCSIYEHRPEGCRMFEPNGDACRSAIFVNITRRGKTLFVKDEPESWPSDETLTGFARLALSPTVDLMQKASE